MSGAAAIVERLEALPLRVEAAALLPRELAAGGWTRLTTLVRLTGAGRTGLGEDVCYEADDQRAFREGFAGLPPAGADTLGGFLAALDEVDPFPRPPRQAASRLYRRWAFESAAADLALRQSGLSLAALAPAAPAPVRFVASPSLGSPPDVAAARRRVEAAGGVELKLDVTPDWNDDRVLEALVALGRVQVVDFKGQYHGTPVDGRATAALHARVAEAFPGAWLEDPVWDEATRAALEGHRHRVSWDAPVHGPEDLERLPSPPGAINVKPSRSGSWRALAGIVDWCRRHDVPMYGGGQFELDAGRGQIQYLASLYYPDGPNDVAPRAYHATPPPARLPSSPLCPAPEPTGFRWRDDGSPTQ